MPVFPLPQRPKLSYKQGKKQKRFFGAGDRGGRLHAACDLIVDDGTEVYAVTDGILLRSKSDWYNGAGVVEIKHPLFTIRYGEIEPVEDLNKKPITEGMVIGHVKRMHKDSMLHFEMYSGQGSGALTQKGHGSYSRRDDLIDPTPYLDKWPLKSSREASP